MTFFKIGDVVKTNMDAQGMTKGERYRVVDVLEGAFGVVTYTIAPVSRVSNPLNGEAGFSVCNLHVLARRVTQNQPGLPFGGVKADYIKAEVKYALDEMTCPTCGRKPVRKNHTWEIGVRLAAGSPSGIELSLTVQAPCENGHNLSHVTAI